MVEPSDVGVILRDAARLMQSGELVVFGSASLAFWLDDAPRTRDVGVWCEPEERGELVEALMGELSWYHDTHDAYVEVWRPETFAAPTSWRSRARRLTDADLPGVTLLVPHPHDVLLSKVERWQPSDQEHASRILAAYPLDATGLASLADDAVHRQPDFAPQRSARFEAHLAELQAMLQS